MSDNFLNSQLLNSRIPNSKFKNQILHTKIYIVGYMAAGKTTFGKQLAEALQFSFLDLDEYISREEGLSINEIFAQKGEAYFREAEQNVLAKTKDLKNFIIACGGGTPCYFNNMDFILENGYCIWVKENLDTIVKRLEKGKLLRPLIKDKTALEITNLLQEHYMQRLPFYKKAPIVFDAECNQIKEFVIFIKALINASI